MIKLENVGRHNITSLESESSSEIIKDLMKIIKKKFGTQGNYKEFEDGGGRVEFRGHLI